MSSSIILHKTQKACVSLPLYIRSIIRSIVKVLFIQPFSLHFYIHIAYVYSHHSKNRKCNQIYFKRNSKDSKLHIVFVNSYYLFIIDGVKDHLILFSSLMVFQDDFFYHFTKFESFRNSITFFWGQLVIIAKYYSLCCLPTYFPKRPFKPTFVESGLFTCRKKPFIGLRSPREANRRLREQNQLAFRLNCQFYS